MENNAVRPVRFHLGKAIQATAVLLRGSPGRRSSYLRLLKLLYLAERRSLEATGCPITGDRVVAMDNGPVMSRTYDLILGRDPEASEWQRFIETDGYSVTLADDPGNADLCPYEIGVLQQVADEHYSTDGFDLVDQTHKLPEWQKHHQPGTATTIPLRDILEAVGRGDEADDIEADTKELAAIQRILGR